MVTKTQNHRFYKSLAFTLLLMVGIIQISSSDSEEITRETHGTRIWPDNLFGVDFTDNKNGWISGYAGTLLRTTDGGNSWLITNIGRNELIRRIDFVDTMHGWAVGHRGSIFHTTDSGMNWEIQHNETGVYLRDVSFADREHGWVVGHDATILHTTDGGKSWEIQKLTGFKGRDLPRLHAVIAEDRDNAILVGEFGVMATTSDGGKTWPVIPNKSKKTLLSIAMVNDHFIAPGLDGTIAHIVKNDTGEYDIKWLETNTKEHFFAVSSAPDGTVIAAGRSIVVKITGETVTKLAADESIALPFTWFGGVAALKDGSFWLVGIRGTIAKGDLAQEKFRFALNIGNSEQVTINNDPG